MTRIHLRRGYPHGAPAEHAHKAKTPGATGGSSAGPVKRYSNSAPSPDELEALAEALQLFARGEGTGKSVEQLEALVEHLRTSNVDRSSAPRSHRIVDRLEPDVLDAVVARYQAGDGTPVVAKAFGISETAVKRLLRDRGIELRMRPISPTVLAKATELYERRLGVQRIATELKVSKTTLLRAMKKAGVAMRPPKHSN